MLTFYEVYNSIEGPVRTKKVKARRKSLCHLSDFPVPLILSAGGDERSLCDLPLKRSVASGGSVSQTTGRIQSGVAGSTLGTTPSRPEGFLVGSPSTTCYDTNLSRLALPMKGTGHILTKNPSHRLCEFSSLPPKFLDAAARPVAGPTRLLNFLTSGSK
jgi:hypothetical protein